MSAIDELRDTLLCHHLITMRFNRGRLKNWLHRLCFPSTGHVTSRGGATLMQEKWIKLDLIGKVPMCMCLAICSIL